MKDNSMGLIWTLIVGAIAGFLAKLIYRGENEPQGFVLTTLLGIIGAFVFTFIGQVIGLYDAGDGAGIIGATLGAVLTLFVWGYIRRTGNA